MDICRMLRYLIFLIGFSFVCITSVKAGDPIVSFSFNKANLSDDKDRCKGKGYNFSFVDDRFGNRNSACYIQGGEGSYLNLGTSDLLKPKVGTISLWINIEHPMLHGKGIESNPILFTRSHDGEDHNEAFYIGYDYETKNLNINTTLSKEEQITMYSIKAFDIRKWHHVAMAYDNKFLSFYIDGVLQAKLPKSFQSQFLKGDSILIGKRNSEKNKRYFNGSIDDLQIYDIALSEEEIQGLYNLPDPNKDKVNRQVVTIIIIIIAFLFLIFWLIRKRIRTIIKRQSERNMLELHALEQEIKMLKAQMDPHFIFNSMNTILQFIITKQNDKAELYLTKFSKLIRMLLESNTNEGISLRDELDILKKYLEIEALRFDQVIVTHLEIDPEINENKIYIPHMMIQPFVENAIWHGLRLKEGERSLKIKFEKKDEKTLFCIIDDNGVGRNTNGENGIEKENRSLAINFIKQRLELMNKKYDGTYSLNVIDKVDEQNNTLGTRVEITLPIISR